MTDKTRAPLRLVVAFATSLALIATGTAAGAKQDVGPRLQASADDSPCTPHALVRTVLSSTADPPYDPEQEERVIEHSLVEEASGSEVRVLVLLPVGYEDGSEREYPVVYLLSPGAFSPDIFLTGTDLIEFTADQPAERQAIVVLPDKEPHYFVNWRSGAFDGEDFFVEKLLPFIDEEYRTIPGGRHRAIGGYSGGGFSAGMLTGRHAERFGALATFSGLVDLTDPVAMPHPLLLPEARCLDPFGTGGDPITDLVWWHDLNPTTLAPNYRGMGVSVTSRNGMLVDEDGGPCDEDLVRFAAGAWSAPVEMATWRWSQSFHAALDAANVEHHNDLDRCGTHAPPYLEHQVKDWWGWTPDSPSPLFDALGTPAPAIFDHRRAAGTFRAHGWTFQADPDRAPEFLDVKDASRRGVTLTGSGTTTMVTAPYFGVNQKVRVTIEGPDGTRTTEVVRARDRRLEFQAELGPPHEHQQYTPQQRALEAAEGPAYWRTATVTFAPGAGHGAPGLEDRGSENDDDQDPSAPAASGGGRSIAGPDRPTRR